MQLALATFPNPRGLCFVTTSLLHRLVVSPDISEGSAGTLPVAPTQKFTPVRSAVGRSFGKWIAIMAALALLAAVSFPVLGHFWKGFSPFASKKVDRTQPALLSAISNLADYRAASAQFTVVVDIEDDAKWLPAAVRGERTVLLASGSVDAGVDLSGLGASALVIDEANKSVVVRLPHATLRKAQLDLAKTTVVQHKRGLLDRVGSAFGDAPAGENKAMRLAQTKLEKAARESTVLATAEANTTTMMTSLVRGLGYTNVRVEFVNPPLNAADQ
jgi:hypothetical protein